MTPYVYIFHGSSLGQVTTCCLTTPSHYLNRFWFIIKGFVALTWEHFRKKTHELNPWHVFGYNIFELPTHLIMPVNEYQGSHHCPNRIVALLGAIVNLLRSRQLSKLHKGNDLPILLHRWSLRIDKCFQFTCNNGCNHLLLLYHLQNNYKRLGSW